MEKQRTIAEEVSFSGIGLHTGSLTAILFKPAPPDSGITFYRVDLPGKPAIQADIDHVEHVLAAAIGLGIDNLDIEMDANEIPNGDGSAFPFMTTLKNARLIEQEAPRKYITIDRPVFYRQDDVTLSVLPADELRITMTIAYDHVAIGTQYASFTITPDTFEREIAPARTFCFLREVKMLQEQGLIKGGSIDSAVVIGDETILNDDLRFPDEPVRHKILDLLGDMYLLGRRLKGHVIGVKCGHEKNVMFSKQIKKAYLNGHADFEISPPTPAAKHAPALDVNMIMKALPHRFPFLLVDRILAFAPGERVVGIKNVTVNEPYFQGHWPSVPVMPGVLIIEVMAQVSSVLILGGQNRPPGRLAFFMGVDRAKFRRTVGPGDQIVVESEMLHVRRNACKVKAIAKVDDVLAAEAIMTFGLMDAPE